MTATSPRMLARPAGWLLAGAVGARVGSLVATIVLSRILVPKHFGELALVQTAVSLAAGVAGLGLGVALTRRVADSRSSDARLAGRYLGWAIWITVLAGLLATAAYVAAAQLLSKALIQSSSATNFIYASALAVFSSAVITAEQGGLMGLQGFRRMAASQLAQGLLAALGLIVGALVDDAVGALIGFSVGTLGAAAMTHALLHREAALSGIRLRLNASPVERRRMWTVAGPALAAFVVLYAALLGGQLLLSRSVGGYQKVALFNVAFRWHLGILFIPGAIAPALLPMIAGLRSQGSVSDVRGLFRLNVVLAAALTAVPAIVLIAAAPVVMGMSGAYYSRHPGVLIVLALAAVPGALNNVLSAASVGVGAIRAWLLSDVVLALAFFGTAVALVPAAGAVGLGWAYLAGYVATDGALVLPLRRRLRA